MGCGPVSRRGAENIECSFNGIGDFRGCEAGGASCKGSGFDGASTPEEAPGGRGTASNPGGTVVVAQACSASRSGWAQSTASRSPWATNRGSKIYASPRLQLTIDLRQYVVR